MMANIVCAALEDPPVQVPSRIHHQNRQAEWKTAETFYVGYEILNPGAMIPFHKPTNSEEWSS